VPGSLQETSGIIQRCAEEEAYVHVRAECVDIPECDAFDAACRMTSCRSSATSGPHERISSNHWRATRRSAVGAAGTIARRRDPGAGHRQAERGEPESCGGSESSALPVVANGSTRLAGSRRPDENAWTLHRPGRIRTFPAPSSRPPSDQRKTIRHTTGTKTNPIVKRNQKMAWLGLPMMIGTGLLLKSVSVNRPHAKSRRIRDQRKAAKAMSEKNARGKPRCTESS